MRIDLAPVRPLEAGYVDILPDGRADVHRIDLILNWGPAFVK